uniref:Uncharacterized protein n=1 Tax=Biomphalaria glabrata TaxID=6526 RepID=A0A2C9K895_BIOGL
METPLVCRMTRSKQKEFDEKNAERTKSPSPRRRRRIKPKEFSEDNDAEMLTLPISGSIARRQKKFNVIYPDYFTPKMQSKNTKLEERKLSYSVKHTRNKQILLKNLIPERSKQQEFDEENAKMMDSYKADEKINPLEFQNVR